MFGFFAKSRNIKIKNKDGKEDITFKLSEKQIKEKEEYIKNLISQQNIPIILLDNEWYKIKKLVGNEQTEAKEKKLKDLLKEQGNLVNEIKQDEIIKHNFMQEVLRVSDVVNSGKDDILEKELDKLHQGIVKINKELTEKEERLEKVESDMKRINLEILEEAMAIGYEGMEIYKKKSEELSQEIDVLREQVVNKTNEKKLYDENFNILYQYLHNMIGYKHIDKVDKKIEEGNKDD